MNIDTSLLDKAICFAVKAHAGVERRGKNFPYIVHPLEAVAIVATMTSDQELLAAAALHDVVEDTDISLADIQREFGPRVASLVEQESDCGTPEKPESVPWVQRKQATIDHLAAASRDAKMVALGDKLSNARAIWRDYQIMGDHLWNLFHEKDKALHKWHYEGLVDSLKELSDTFAWQEFHRLVTEVFNG